MNWPFKQANYRWLARVRPRFLWLLKLTYPHYVRCDSALWNGSPLRFAKLFGSGSGCSIPYNRDYYELVDRLEIRGGKWSSSFHSSQKPYFRSQIIRLVDSLASKPISPLSPTDRFNLIYLKEDDKQEVVPSDLFLRTTNQRWRWAIINELRGVSLKTYSLPIKKTDLRINPVLGLGWGKETASTLALPAFTVGVETRGVIAKTVGYYGFFTANQAVYPRYIRAYGQLYGVTGAGFALGEGNAWPHDSLGTSFFSLRGYLTTHLLKVMSLQIGHDRLFLGNGYRSVFLSDNSAPYWFAKLTTTLGPVQYTNLLTRLQNGQTSQFPSVVNPAKFMVMHHLSVNLNTRFNVGLFEAEVFSRDNGIDLNYLNPIILYRYVESSIGSQDNALLGFDLKTLVGQRGQLYSQVVLDEFRLNDLLAGQGSWTNKFAIQLGGKYIDALGVTNLDVQGELNLARPFTYSHQSGQTNYAHFNQPLAHPLGGNFIELLAMIRYQRQRLFIEGIVGWMLVGRDPPGLNYGGNVLKDYGTRFRSEGNFIGQGRKTFITYADLRLSYMIGLNLFLEARSLYRLEDSQFKADDYLTVLGSVGVRWNLPYRSWVF